MLKSTSYSSTAEPPRKRGRPRVVSKWYSLDEVAALLCWNVDALARLLHVHPELVPGAVFEDGVWQVRGSELVASLGSRALEQRVTVEDVARAYCVPVKTVYSWLALRGPKGEVAIPSHCVFGKHRVRMFASDVRNLPASWPSWAALSFFSAKGGARVND